jgi:hypothetical protein
MEPAESPKRGYEGHNSLIQLTSLKTVIRVIFHEEEGTLQIDSLLLSSSNDFTRKRLESYQFWGP